MYRYWTGKLPGAFALGIIFLLVVWGLARPWGLGLDFANFYDAGRKMLVGEQANLYDSTVLIGGQKPLGNMTFFSAPISAFLYAPMALLSPHVATVVFKLAGALATLAGLIILFRQMRPASDDRYFSIFWMAALLWQPFWTVFRIGGQTTPLAFLLLVLAHGSFVRGQTVFPGLMLSAVVLIKPAFAPLAVLMFVMAGNRFRMTALAAGAVTAVLSMAIFGWPLHEAFLQRAAAEGRALLVPWMNSSPTSWIVPLFVSPADYAARAPMPEALGLAVSALRGAIAVALIAVMVGHLRRDLTGPARRHVIFATGLLLIMVGSPVVWSHYLSILFIPLAMLFAGRQNLPALAQAILIVAIVLGLGQSMILLRQLELHFGFDTRAEFLAAALFKSLPALLVLTVWLGWRGAVGRILSAPGWKRFDADRQPTANIVGITTAKTPDAGSAG